MIPAVITSIERHNDSVYTFWFMPEVILDYTAGQFIEMSISHDADERGAHRWFTLSSSPTEELLAITTRKVTKPSTFKQQLFSLKIGDKIHISQAMGDFVLPIQKTVPILFLVRGIGATPARSILTTLHNTGERREITVIQSAKNKDDLLFASLFQKSGNYEYIYNSSNIDVREAVNATLHQLTKTPDARVFISGPEQFVERVYESLLSKKIKSSSIVTDYFHGYEA